MPPSADRSAPQKNSQRRLLLRVAVKLMLGFSVVVVAVLMLLSLGSGERPDVTVVDLTKLAVNQAQKVSWQGHSVWVVRRDVFAVDALPSDSPQLLDRGSQEAPLPQGVSSYHRGLNKRYLVVLARGAECSVEWRAGKEFYEPCSGLRYDIAGRLFFEESLPLGAAHLQVPDHRIAGASLVIGQSPEAEEPPLELW